MKEYRVVSTILSENRLTGHVNDLIPLGWVPIGGICVSNGIFYQAMVRG